MRAFKRSVAHGALALGIVALAAAPGFAAPADPAPEATFYGLKKHSPWTAAGLSLAVSGLGQYYNDQPDKGNWMLGSLALFPAAWALDALTGTAYARTIAFIALLTVKGVSVQDAWVNAAPAPEPPK